MGGKGLNVPKILLVNAYVVGHGGDVNKVARLVPRKQILLYWFCGAIWVVSSFSLLC